MEKEKVVRCTKEDMNEKTKSVLDKLHYEDAEFFHKMVINLAQKKGICIEN